MKRDLLLRLLPKSFGFRNDLQKGFFPHALNTLSNIDYVNECLPAINEFGSEEMFLEERERVLKWYDTENEKLKNSGERYELRKEMK